MTAESLFSAEPQTSIWSQVVACGPAAVSGADVLGMREAHLMATAGGADLVEAAVLAEPTDGGEQCRGRHQLMLRSGAVTLLDGQRHWIAPRRRPLRSPGDA